MVSVNVRLKRKIKGYDVSNFRLTTPTCVDGIERFINNSREYLTDKVAVVNLKSARVIKKRYLIVGKRITVSFGHFVISSISYFS
ncbi:hypothetical protein D1872_253230 [compost metagenome]